MTNVSLNGAKLIQSTQLSTHIRPSAADSSQLIDRNTDLIDAYQVSSANSHPAAHNSLQSHLYSSCSLNSSSKVSQSGTLNKMAENGPTANSGIGHVVGGATLTGTINNGLMSTMTIGGAGDPMSSRTHTLLSGQLLHTNNYGPMFPLHWNKRCVNGRQCYWRIASIALACFVMCLLALFAYRQSIGPDGSLGDDLIKPCILVEDSPPVPLFPPPSFAEHAVPGRSESVNSGHHKVSADFLNQLTQQQLSQSIANQKHQTDQEKQDFLELDSESPVVRLPVDASKFVQLQETFSDQQSQPTFWALSSRLPANGATGFRLRQAEPILIQITFAGLQQWTRLALFGQRSQPPTLTSHELLHNIAATASSEKQHLHLKLESGLWYFTLVNDAPTEFLLKLNLTSVKQEFVSANKDQIVDGLCPNHCSTHGYCDHGQCRCSLGWSGVDCSESACPLLCSGNGNYMRGVCRCFSGWTGLECDQRVEFCDHDSCGNNGACIGGLCVCNPTFSGSRCEILSIVTSTLDKNLTCVATDDHHTNIVLEAFEDVFYSSLPTDHAGASQGLSDTLSESMAECIHRCANGNCELGVCRCNRGYQGRFCSLSGCPNNCSGHGQCLSINESTFSTESSLSELLNAASLTLNISSTSTGFDSWQCVCSGDWTGVDCSYQLERNCADDIDNDNDGLIDCADSECCAKDECKDSLMCLTSPDPLDILLRKSPISPTASFYQRMKFLIEESSVQSYAHRDEYSESEFWSAFEPSRVSVIRGRIITPDGNGLSGIRISVANDNRFGFTLPRSDGWFDILVNGGTMVTLHLQRIPFHPVKRTVFAPANQIFVLHSPIVMSVLNGAEEHAQLSSSATINSFHSESVVDNVHETGALSFDSEEDDTSKNSQLHKELLQYTHQNSIWTARHLSSHHHYLRSSHHNTLPRIISGNLSHKSLLHCWSHDYNQFRPQLLRPDSSFYNANFQLVKSAAILESGMLQEIFSLPGSKLNLVYQSSASSGFMTVFYLRLIDSDPTETLRLVHLRLAVEGNLHSTELEPSKHLSYTYAWNRRNVYKQKVYGRAVLRVYAGYEYSDCDHIVWTTFSTEVEAFPPENSHIGNWKLQVHHRFEPSLKTLFMGDGRQLKSVESVTPTNLESPFYRIVGDYEKSRDLSFVCDKSVNLLPPQSNQRLQDQTMLQCALLSRPSSSFVIAADGSIVFVDGDLVRKLRADGQLYTVFRWVSPAGVNSNIKTQLYISLSPHDQHLFITDVERLQILRLTQHQQPPSNAAENFELFAGNGQRCYSGERPVECGDGGLAIHARLSQPKSIAFAPDGSMYLADGWSVRRINRRSIIHTLISSAESRPLQSPICPTKLDNFKLTRSARRVKLAWPVLLAVSPLNDRLFVLDDHSAVYMLTAEHRLHLVYGSPAHCSSSFHKSQHIASMAFDAEGRLFLSILENESQVIKVLDSEGKLTDYLRIDRHTSHKNKIRNFGSFADENYLKKEEEFCIRTNSYNCSDVWQHLSHSLEQSPSSSLIAANTKVTNLVKIDEIGHLAISTDNVLFVSDAKKPQIVKIQKFYHSTQPENSQYTLADSASEQLHVFNAQGIHLVTLNALTGHPIYTFQYETNSGNSGVVTPQSRLLSVTDASGFRVTLQRSGGKVIGLECSNGLRVQTQLDNRSRLLSIHRPDGLRVQYQYTSNGLLRGRTDSARYSVYYEYDIFGRIKAVLQPTGVLEIVDYSLDKSGNLHVRISKLGSDLGQTTSIVLISNQNEQLAANSQIRLLNLQSGTVQLISRSFKKEKHAILVASGLHPVILNYLPPHSQLNLAPMLLSRLQKKHFSSEKKKPRLNNVGIRWAYEMRWKTMSYADSSNPYHNLQQLQRLSAVERVLYVNGTRFLSIEYDHSANREILYNSTRRPFLMVQYDNHSRPIQWLHTESRLPLNLLYDSAGRLIGWQQGQRTSENYVYAANDRLSEIKYPDGSAIKYQEETNESGHTRTVSLRSGKTFVYRFDLNDGLYEIDSGEGVKHKMQIHLTLGMYKLIYWAPGFGRDSSQEVLESNEYAKDELESLNNEKMKKENGFVIFFDENRRPLLIRQPGGFSKILFKYSSAHSQLALPEEILFGNGKVTRKYNTEGQLLWELNAMQGIEQETPRLVRTVYRYENRLISNILTELNLQEWTPNLRLETVFDEWRRKLSVQLSCDMPYSDHLAVSLSPTTKTLLKSCKFRKLEYSYSPHTGRISRIGEFHLKQLHELGRPQNESRWSDLHATLSRQFDSSSLQPRQVSLQLHDKQVYRAVYTYDTSGKLQHIRKLLRLLSTGTQVRMSTVNYTYDADGQLVQVKADREHWRFSYDQIGNLQRIQYGSSVITLRVDSKLQRISAFGDTEYIYDENGWLICRGHEKLSYNSLGQLLSVSREQLDGPTQVDFAYDARGRLSWRADSVGNRTVFIYGDVERPHLCTHSLHWHAPGGFLAPNTLLAITYVYDEHGFLIAFHRSDSLGPFYVVCDQVGSPSHVFHEGQLIKELHRSPFGHILRDTLPSSLLVIGFHGAIADPLLSIVFLQPPFAYDTLTGQYLQPNFGQALHSGQKQPQFLSVYRFAKNDPINAAFAGSPLHDQQLDLNRWIQHQGIELSALDLQMKFIRPVVNPFLEEALASSDFDSTASLSLASSINSERWPHHSYGQRSTTFDALLGFCLHSLQVPRVSWLSSSDATISQLGQQFARISFVQRPQLKAKELPNAQTYQLATVPGVLGPGVRIVFWPCFSGKCIRVLADPSTDSLLSSVWGRVLNDSILLKNDLHNNALARNGETLHFLRQHDQSRVGEDFNDLRRLGDLINVTIREIDNNSDNAIEKEATGDLPNKYMAKVDLHVTTTHGTVVVRYGGKLNTQRQKLVLKAFRLAAARAWASFRSKDNTYDEKKTLIVQQHELITTGNVLNFTARPFHNLIAYPELADDPSNVRFDRKVQ